MIFLARFWFVSILLVTAPLRTIAQVAEPSTPASGVVSSTQSTTKTVGTEQVTTTQTVTVRPEDENSFLRQFSVGVGSMNLKGDEVRKASVAGGVVRIDEASQYRNAFWLQTNWVVDKKPFGWKYWPSTIRPGIWAGLEVGSDNKLLNGIAGGLQISFIRLQKGSNGESTSAVNLGYGWFRSSMQTLADGLEAGKALPSGIESVSYRQRSVTGKMWMLSLNVAAF